MKYKGKKLKPPPTLLLPQFVTLGCSFMCLGFLSVQGLWWIFCRRLARGMAIGEFVLMQTRGLRLRDFRSSQRYHLPASPGLEMASHYFREPEFERSHRWPYDSELHMLQMHLTGQHQQLSSMVLDDDTSSIDLESIHPVSDIRNDHSDPIP
jgi:hypothetical protein